MSGSILVSYRRSDAGGHAGRLHDRLAHWFDADELFFDVEHINPGDLFPQRLADGIDNAKVVLALIGPALYAAARHGFKRALAMNWDDRGEEHPDTLTSMSNLAITLWHCDERRDAVELMTRTVVACTSKLGAHHPDTFERVNTLAQMRAAFDAVTAPSSNTP